MMKGKRYIATVSEVVTIGGSKLKVFSSKSIKARQVRNNIRMLINDSGVKLEKAKN